jgi:glycosyltransferase involved in cell wall biosynthesis
MSFMNIGEMCQQEDKNTPIPVHEISDPSVLTSEPLVSINMLTYNHGSYIVQAIEGVLSQKTDFSFELVIGEDCSTDETKNIVRDYQEKYPEIIRIITSDNNVGMKKNFLRCAKESKGKYIAFCEGDDFWHYENKLQIQAEYLQENEKCGLVSTDYDLNYLATGKIVTNYRKSLGRDDLVSPDIDDIILGRASILTLTVMVRKCLVERLIYSDKYLHENENLLMCDTQLWAEVSSVSRIHCMDLSTAIHNVLAESASQSKDLVKSLKFWKSNAEMAIYVCEKYNLDENIRNLHERSWRRKSLKIAFFEERVDLAIEAREKFNIASFKDEIWYLGTKYKYFRVLIRFLHWSSNLKQILKLKKFFK